MSLILRLMNRDYESPPLRVPFDTFLAGLVEAAAGKVSAAQFVAEMGLSPEEQGEAQALYLAIRNGNAALAGATAMQRLVEVDGVLRLASSSVLYPDEASVRARLGIA